MKLSTFVGALAWSTFFGVAWIGVLQNDFNASRICVMVISFVVGVGAALAASQPSAMRKE